MTIVVSVTARWVVGSSKGNQNSNSDCNIGIKRSTKVALKMKPASSTGTPIDKSNKSGLKRYW